MIWYAVKVLVSCALIVGISEVAKRSSLWGGLLASVPLVSVLGFLWLYADTGDPGKVSALSRSIFWLVLPSLPLFLLLPLFLRWKWNFYASLGLCIVVTAACTGVMALAMARLGAHS
jgi:hypothetical protein